MPRRRPSSCSGELMANAWIIEPIAPTRMVFDYGGAPVAGTGANLFNDYAGVVWRRETTSPAQPTPDAGTLFDVGRDMAVDTMLVFGLEGVADDTAIQLYGWTDAEGQVGNPSVAFGDVVGPGAPSTSGKRSALIRTDVPIVARYFQFSIYPKGPGTVGAARLVIGRRIELERNFSFGAGFGVKDLGSLEFSRRGVLLRNRGAKLRTTALTFSSVRRDEVEQLTKPLLERIGNTECVALVTDPAPDVQRPSRCYFGPLVGDLSQTWRRADAWEAKINMVSIF